MRPVGKGFPLRVAVVAVALCAPVALCLLWAARQESARRQLDEARSALGRGDLARAHALLGPLASRGVGRGEASYLLGVCEMQRGDLDAALEALRRVPEDSPSSGDAATRGGAVALERGAFELGERMLRDALGRPGDHEAEALELLGRILRFQDRRGEARALLRRQLGRSDDPIRVVRDLWLLDAEAVPVDRTRTMFEEAARSHPGDPRVQLGLANLALRSGRLDEAGRRLDACLRALPDDPPTWRARLDWAIASGDPEEARCALAHLPPDRLEPAELLEIEAWLAARADDRGRERLALERLLEWRPAHPSALDRLAELAVEAGDDERSAEYRREKAELDRDRDRYDRLLRLEAPELAPRARELARLAGRLGRRDEARGSWIAVARQEPGDPEAIDALARLDEEQRRRTAELAPLASRLASGDPVEGAPPASSPGPGPGPSPGRGAAPSFEDRAEADGLRFRFEAGHSPDRHLPETMSGGVGLLDVDGDGWLDVYLPQGGEFPPGRTPDGPGDRLFRNLGGGTFEDATDRAGFPRSGRGYGLGVAAGDYDNDGDPDLFVTRFDSYELWRNRGDGTFEDVTGPSGLGVEAEWPTSAAWADLDDDGDLDLYVCHYLAWDEHDPRTCLDPETGRPIYCEPLLFEAVPDRLFRNDEGRFVDVAEQAGIVDRDGRGLGVVAADLDGDRLVDLYVANDLSANFLFRNLGGMRFEEVGERAGVASNADGGYQAGMGIACGDLDGDGLPELAVTNFYAEGTTLYRNLGGGQFVDASAAFGMAPSRYLLGFGVAFLDANNDGFLDLASANGMVNDSRPLFPYAMPAQLLVGGPGGLLADLTDRAGPDWQAPRVGRGLAAGDLDNDGLPDVVLVPQDGPLALLRNRTPGGHFVTVRLEGTDSARDAVGARVVVDDGDRRRVGWRVGGGSYQSSPDPRLHFGLGEAGGPVSIEVAWPSGRVDRHDGLAVDSGYLIREGDSRPGSLPGFGR
ncbi:FG-GAP-like repeat-containing protein [Tautonia plasticadhaerens]|uniref:Cellulose synthase operon protein C n=1 Tax=Tautonia plasticadhaerens TaxID=2527974 RepID=A0A518HDK7_9BACT|nr:FG-GAP-like repeat-containing protein [Tautonia plasticadhaerens]QDV38941.1 Cellulose synthase operon protein C precursor [Tautonia plasticadhaerens]